MTSIRNSVVSNLKFAAFIMTYERPQLIANTIHKILAQTFIPAKILVIDNSSTHDTEKIISDLGIASVSYYRIGFNAGPAGAAQTGLKILAEDGFDWIYWGDDDDPPETNDVFESLLEMALKLEDAGAVGSIGGYLNRFSGRTRNLANHELQDINEVDYIPGNKNFIVNVAVVRKNILPTPELFFGFEELDYCLKMKAAGFKIYIDGHTVLKGRQQAGKIDPDYRWQSKNWGKKLPGQRQYYSSRNILLVLSKNRLYVALVFMLGKTMLKALFGFRYGIVYGKRSLIIHTHAILDFLMNKKGQRNLV